jgi:hypothetical protein
MARGFGPVSSMPSTTHAPLFTKFVSARPTKVVTKKIAMTKAAKRIVRAVHKTLLAVLFIAIRFPN